MTEEAKEKMPKNSASLYKYVALVVLAVQNTCLVLTMRYVSTRPNNLFRGTTGVVMSELFKLVACLVLVTIEEGGVLGCLRVLKRHVIENPIDTLKVAVPAFIYTIQNNLLYIAVDNLSAAAFQVLYQTKILTTALFSVFMLSKSISKLQWISLFILAGGVALVQYDSSNAKQSEGQNAMLGFIVVVISSFASGFAGVYFERILKGGKPVSIWLRNIQLAVISAPLALMTCLICDRTTVEKNGFFAGYDYYVLAIISIQAFGGLVVAFVVKYADNILKGFATSIAIIMSCIVSIFIFDFVVTSFFLIGALLVISAVMMYNY